MIKNLSSTMFNLLAGLISACILFLFYTTFNIVSFAHAYYGKNIDVVLDKLKIPSVINAGKLPNYISATHYNGKFSDEGKHFNLIKFIKSSENGVVLIIWSPSCKKCVKHLTSLAKFSLKYPDKKFLVVTTPALGVSIEETRKVWQNMMKNPHNLYVLKDSEDNMIFRTLFELSGQQVVPMTAFINNKLDVLSIIPGQIRWDLYGNALMKAKFEIN